MDSAPDVSTDAATDVEETSFTANMTVSGGGTVTSISERGFAWIQGSSGTPETSDNTEFETGSFGNSFSWGTTINSLSPSTDYRVRAYAINSVGTTYGGTITVTTATPVVAPTDPPTLSSPQKSPTTADLAWTAVDDAEEYELQRDEVTIYTGPALTFQDDGLDPETQYTYRVRGTSSGGDGPWSSELQVTTDEEPTPEPTWGAGSPVAVAEVEETQEPPPEPTWGSGSSVVIAQVEETQEPPPEPTWGIGSPVVVAQVTIEVAIEQPELVLGPSGWFLPEPKQVLTSGGWA